MRSVLDGALSDREKTLLEIYRSPANDIRRAARSSVGYALGTGLLAVGLVMLEEPVVGVFAVYAVFLIWMAIRLLNGWTISGIMPGIIEKYEAEIEKLREELRPASAGPPGQPPGRPDAAARGASPCG